MKVNANVLREVLQTKITLINNMDERSKIYKKEVAGYMAKKYNIKHGVGIDIFNGVIPLETQTYDILYKLMISIREALSYAWEVIDLNGLSDELYFTEEEITLFDCPIEFDTEFKDIEISEWFQLSKDFYCCKVNISEIIKWRDINRINYNPKTQRSLTVKESGGIIIKVVTLFPNSLRQIFKLMSKNEFFSGDITLNINPDISEGIKIVRGKLIIPEGVTVDISDGFHQFLSMCDVKDKNKNWDYNTVVYISMFNEEKANKYIYQKDKKNHLTEEQTVRIDSDNESDYILNRLNESSTFNLKGTIDDNVYFSMNRAITHIFHPEERKESYGVYELLEKNINLLVEKNGYFDKVPTKEEWFIYLHLINVANKNNIDFVSLFNEVATDRLIKSIKFKKEPLVKHYKLLNVAIKEAGDYVL